MSEIITLKCPFCKKGDVKVSHTPEAYGSQTIRVGSNRKTIPKLTPAKDDIISDKCPVCGKSKKELQMAFKEGTKPSREEIIRRAKEAGLPLTF